MNRKSLFPGIALIILGVIFLLPNFTSLGWNAIWPLFVLAPGIWFFFLFVADRTKYGVLMPASIVTVTGALLLYCSLTDWSSMEDLWPFFIIAPGIGFLLMYQFGRKEPGLLVPAAVLIVLGLVFLIGMNLQEYFWPIVLIAVGLFMLLRGRKSPGMAEQSPTKPSHTA